MSHVCAVSLEVRSLDDLEAACKRLGFKFMRGQKTWKWFSRYMADYHEADAAYHHGIRPEDYGKSDHAIQVPGAEYEIGVVRRPDGKPGYVLVFDFFDNNLTTKVGGRGCEKIKQAYAAVVTKRSLKRKGYKVTEEEQQDGSLVLRARK